MDIQRLSVSERILLAQELWESVAKKVDDIPFTQDQSALLASRLQAFAADQNMGDSWEIVKRRILSA